MIDKVETLTVADAVVEKLLGYISSGKLQWGQKMPSQRELAKMMNVGVSSVREALQVLQAMGFAEVRRGQGTYVTRNSSVPLTKTLTRSLYQDTSVQELMELREVLDTGLAVLAAKKAEYEDIKAMDECLKVLEKNCDSHSSEAAASDLEFHVALAASVKNPLLAQFSEAVQVSYAKFFGEVSHTSRGAALHRNVLDRIWEHDPLGARDAMIELLKHTREIYLKDHFNRGTDE